ncbi:hypothetical protein ACWEQ4_04120 [Rhodococcus sp. NPDC003994]
MANQLEWRVRAVESVVLDAASTCLRRRSLQIAPMRALLAPHLPRVEKAGPWTHAVVGLPIAPFPRGPLLDFDIDGPSGPASLLPRAETATREALYLEGLATQLGVTVTESVRALLVEVLGWADAETDHADLFDDPVLDSVGPAARREWLRVSADCGRMLGPYVAALGETAVTNPAVAMSALARMGFWQSESEGSAMLAGYRDLVRVATQTAFGRDDRAPIAGEFLAALGDYADTYDLMAAVRIPLDEPFVVKCSERRDLRLDSRRNTGHQDLVIADARSNHVTVTVRDPNVRISRADAFRAGDSELAVGTSVTRRNDQFVAFYSQTPTVTTASEWTSASRFSDVWSSYRFSQVRRPIVVGSDGHAGSRPSNTGAPGRAGGTGRVRSRRPRAIHIGFSSAGAQHRGSLCGTRSTDGHRRLSLFVSYRLSSVGLFRA